MAMASEVVLQDPTAALPYEISCLIFSFVPAQEIVRHCVLVCRLWKEISDDQTTWKLKCERTGRFRLEYMKEFEPDNWKIYYYKNPYTRNLLKNPNLTNAFPNFRETKAKRISSWYGFGDLTADEWNAQFDPWQIVSIGGDGLQIECPPIGCLPLPEDVGSSCFATSHEDFIRSQLIDLREERVSQHILDQCKLPIQVCEWFNVRFDCGGKYYLKVTLKDKQRDEIPGFSVKLEGEKQQGRHNWEKVEHVFRDYPAGVRYIHFEDYGRDTKYWAGFYGAKLAGATVKFLSTETIAAMS